MSTAGDKPKFSKDTQINAHGYFGVDPYGEPKIFHRKLKIMTSSKNYPKIQIYHVDSGNTS